MISNYSPERGDLVWIDFDPQIGREQAGRRPAVVLSPGFYNAKSALAWICPVTSKVKGYPFEVLLPDNLPIQGGEYAFLLEFWLGTLSAIAPLSVAWEIRP